MLVYTLSFNLKKILNNVKITHKAMTIYIFRHQEGGETSSNCLSKKGIKHTYSMSNKIKDLEPCTVYTSMPLTNGKHVRPIQTASLVCSRLCKYVHFINEKEFPSNKDDCSMNHVIIWHHGDINKILNMYFPMAYLMWSETNYTGCLVIKEKKWIFYPSFLYSRHIRKYDLLCRVSKLLCF